MARTVEEILKHQLGGLMIEVAVLTSELEKRNEYIKELESRAKVLELAKDT